MRLRYTGTERKTLPTLGREVEPGEVFEADETSGAGFAVRADFTQLDEPGAAPGQDAAAEDAAGAPAATVEESAGGAKRKTKTASHDASSQATDVTAPTA